MNFSNFVKHSIDIQQKSQKFYRLPKNYSK